MIDNRLAPYAALLLRLAIGVEFLTHAALKFFVYTPAGTTRFFESVGVPGALGPVTIVVETLVGVSMIFGIMPRLAALVGVPILVGRSPLCTSATASSSAIRTAVGNSRPSGRSPW